MAHYQNLPVFKAAYNLLLYLFSISNTFKREYKYTLGESLKKELLEMIINLYKTNSQKQKLEFINITKINIETARLQIRILFDLKQLSLKQFAKISADVDSISKQLVAWAKYEVKKNETVTLNNKEMKGEFKPESIPLK